MAEDTSFETLPFAEALLRGARNHADRDCIVLPDQRATYGELAHRSRRAAKALLGLGVDRGDRVGILMANCLDFVDILFGASLIGAIPVLYNARFKAREIAHVTSDANVKVVVTNGIVEEHTDYVELLRRAVPSLGSKGAPIAVFLGPDARPGFVSRDEFYSPADAIDGGHAADDEVDRRYGLTEVADIAAMFYTSGTTAMPKGCPLTHIVLQHAGVVGGERFGLVDGDVMWGPLPMFHTAFTQPLTGILHVGGTYLSMTHFEPTLALQQIAAERATMMFPAFPTVTLQLLDDPSYTPESLASVRAIINVGPQDVLAAMQERMPHTRQITVFGMTETGGSVAMCDPADSLEMRTRCSGAALNGDEICVVDSQGQPLAPGARGEIVVRGRGVFSGYHNDPAKNAEAFDADGWFHTGDLGSLDADGRITFHGRLKDMLKVGGENVACVEIEGFLATHPAVKLAQVVGLPDAKYDEVPVAFIECKPGVDTTERAIIDFCHGEIASFKVPRHVRFVDEWPMGATKILKYELRDNICREFGLSEADA